MRRISALTLFLLITPLLTGAVWYKENKAVGLRDSILLFLAFSRTDSHTLYLATTDGYVFSTHNGGMAWDEARLIVKGKAFFGAIRPTVAPDGVAVSAADILAGSQREGIGKASPQDLLFFEFGELTDEFDMFEQGLHLKAYDPSSLPGMPSIGKMKISDRACSSGGGNSTARLGVGLKSGAPRLKGALRSLKAPSVGMNLQQILVEMGVEPTWLNQVAVHTTDPSIAMAATSMGTYRTTDGGIGWLPVFAGTDRWERDGQAVCYDPLSGDRVYLGTQAGLFISDTGGDRWERVTGTMLESTYVTWIEPVVLESGDVWIYVGTTLGAFLSRDHGQTWKWIFYETLPESNWITSIAVDRNDAGNVLLSTRDGMFASRDAGDSWERSGGLMFTNRFVPRVLIDPTDGSHAFACTETNIWETDDSGATWQVIYMDNSDWKIRNMVFDPHESGVLWVVTSSQLLRLSQKRVHTKQSARVRVFHEIRALEPNETEVMDAVFKNMNIHIGTQARYRNRVVMSALLPELRAVVGYFSLQADAYLDLVPLLGHSGITSDHLLERKRGNDTLYVGMMAMWDLTELVFTFDQLNTGRVFGNVLGMNYNLKFEVARYYNERIRLLYKLIVEPPEDDMAFLDISLRYRELTEHLNALTGGLYDEELQRITKGEISWLNELAL
jgi:photosystem II stability/assembly factor-like uncharacterized protein